MLFIVNSCGDKTTVVERGILQIWVQTYEWNTMASGEGEVITEVCSVNGVI